MRNEICKRSFKSYKQQPLTIDNRGYRTMEIMYKDLRLICHTFKEAPPTRKPSISSFFASSAQLAAFTEPATQAKEDGHIIEPVSHVKHPTTLK